jgi:hypothetical protein
MKIGLSASLLALCFSGMASATEVQLGEATYSGSACPQGSLSIEMGQNKRSASFQFAGMQAQAGETLPFDLQDCDIKFPVQVPKGYKVAVLPVKYSGKSYLPYGTSSQLHLNYYYEYSFGIAQSNFQYRWWGEQMKDYGFLFPKTENNLFWSNCGQDIKLRLNISMMAETNKFHHVAKISLDRMEGFELKVEKCQ